jgi:putative inorganic carbon (hco3(-)) transporter
MMAILLIIIAAASGLVYPSPYAPLIVGGVVAAAAILVFLFREPIWALYAAIFVVLLPSGLLPLQLNSILNRSLAVVALFTWMFNVIVRRQRVTWTWTTLLMFAFILWSAVTLFWAGDSGIAMTSLQVYALRLVLFLFLLLNEIKTTRNLDGLMNVLAVCGWVIALVGVYTFLFLGYTPGTRFQVLSENANGFGILLLVTMPAVLWQAMHPSRRHHMLMIVMGSVYLLLTIGLVAASGSRGSAISLIVTLLAFWFWKSTRMWGMIALLILVLAVIVAPFIFITTIQRFAVTPGDTLLGGRETLWQAGWLLIGKNPWLGVGIGNSPYALVTTLGMAGDIEGQGGISMHNPVLTIWSETGIIGILLYLGVLASAIWSFVRDYFHYKRQGIQYLLPYFALISAVSLGFMASWVKGGGLESDFTYFLVLAFLLIPSGLDIKGSERNIGIDTQVSEKG